LTKEKSTGCSSEFFMETTISESERWGNHLRKEKLVESFEKRKDGKVI
jgi:hypothetical protein